MNEMSIRNFKSTFYGYAGHLARQIDRYIPKRVDARVRISSLVSASMLGFTTLQIFASRRRQEYFHIIPQLMMFVSACSRAAFLFRHSPHLRQVHPAKTFLAAFYLCLEVVWKCV